MGQRVVGKDIFISETAADHRAVGAGDGRESGDVDGPKRTGRGAGGEDAVGHDLHPADAHIPEPVGGRDAEAAVLRQRGGVG